jgi:hypothetical protein
MGFAWHKLLPRKIGTQNCPPPPPCEENDEVSEICVTVCPPDPAPGPFPCAIIDCETIIIGGPPCSEPILIGGIQTNPGKPIEYRINAPLRCYAVSDSTPVEYSGICDFEERTGKVHNYYYRTPNSPSSAPAQITGGPICFKYNAYSVPDRAMVISGRNRYKYFGWGADPSCDATIPTLWDSPGGSGIKQSELSISGRSWPLPNSVLNLPLFGADTSLNSPNTNPCSYGACRDQSCFGVRSNSGIGHYATNSGNGTGYYSFQCFNPQSYANSNYDPVPTCSVWSLVHAVWYQFHNGDESGADASIKASVTSLFSADPGGQQLSGKQNVRYYLETLAGNLLTLGGYPFIYPNVFLWDKAAFEAAGNNTDKWKHIYVIGNANVLFDTQCTNNQSQEIDKFGHVIHLDEVSHDPEYGSTGNARLIQWFGCDPDNGGNIGSIAYTEMNTMNCVPTNSKGQPTNSYCSNCQNEDENGGVNVTQIDCEYRGYKPACPYSPLN